MRRPCIIVDLDNTLIDTAYRKQLILKDKFSIDVTINQIRDDFELNTILGENTEIRKKFFSILDAADAINLYSAPIFQNANDILNTFNKEGISIIYLTARPEFLKEATLNEFTKLGIDLSTSPIFFKTNEYSNTNNLDYKTKIIHDLGSNYFIVAAIGDRIEDVKASANNHIPSILFTSTTQPSQVLNANIFNPAGFQSCADWNEIEKAIKLYISGNKEIQEFRKQMIDLYSKWLGEIDNKLRVSVSIASILCALSGKILIDLSASTTQSGIEKALLYSMLFIFLLALTSLIFALRSITSRFTSGEKSGKAVGVKIKQGFSILFGRHKYESIPGDAISDFEDFKNYDTTQKASAHRTFFYKQYKTYDPDALWNFRFFSIRAANYSKLYGERLASYFLVSAIILLGFWVTLTVIFPNKATQLNTKAPTETEKTK